MADEPLLFELLDRWEDALRAGTPATLGDICRDHPGAMPELRCRAEKLLAVNDWLLVGDSTDDAEDADFHPESLPEIPGHEILEIIAEGGMGVVYKARNIALDDVRAIKLIKSRSLDRPAVRERFLTEMRVLAKLRHPHIVEVLHADIVDGRPYFVMPLIEGGSLEGHLADFRGDRVRIARLMARIARAVDFAHSRKVVHRDLKPANILLVGEETPLISDFGVAKIVTASQADDAEGPSGDMTFAALRSTRSGAVIGTLPYMSPEQVAGKADEIDRPADVWALGVILYEMLTGRRPFGSGNWVSVAGHITDVDPVPPSAVSPDAGRTLSDVAMICLSKEPEQRYSSAGAMADDLEAWLTNRRPVRAGETWRSRARRQVRRFALPAAALVAAGLITMAIDPFGPPKGQSPAEVDPLDEAERRYEEAAAEAIRKLERREKVTFIGDGVAPACLLKFGDGKLEYPHPDRVPGAKLSAYGPALIELLPRVPLTSYRIGMTFAIERFKQDPDVGDGRFGMYWGHAELRGRVGDAVDHLFLDFECDQQYYPPELFPGLPKGGERSGGATAQFWHFRTTELSPPEDRAKVQLPDEMAVRVISSDEARSERTLAVEVRPGEVRYLFNGEEVPELTLRGAEFAEVQRDFAKYALWPKHPDLEDVNITPPLDGAVGIFWIAAFVTVREFTVEPLP